MEQAPLRFVDTPSACLVRSGFPALIGAGNGVLIAYLKVNALIATLATMLMVRGLAFIVSKGQAVGIADERSSALATPACSACRCRCW